MSGDQHTQRCRFDLFDQGLETGQGEGRFGQGWLDSYRQGRKGFRERDEGVRAGRSGRFHFLGVDCMRRRRLVISTARFTPSALVLDIPSRIAEAWSSFIR